jgi:hypothetical protein
MDYASRISMLTEEINNKKKELKEYILSNHNEYKLYCENMHDLGRQIAESNDQELKEKYKEEFIKSAENCQDIKKSIEKMYGI